MAFIARNANWVLLFLITIAALGLVAATVYFQDQFNDINSKYTDKRAELEAVEESLEKQKAAVARMNQDLTLKSSREEQLTGKFEEKRVALETTEVALASKRIENEKLGVERNRLVRDKQQLQSINADLEVTNQNLDSSISKLKSDVASQKNKYEDCKQDLSSCEVTC
jgi:chromosome segregation ATPase